MTARKRPNALNPEIYTQLIRAALPIPPGTDADNERLIGILDGIDNLESTTPEEAAFAELPAIVIDFEDHYRLQPVPPHEALQALMEDRGLQHKDIVEAVGKLSVPVELFL